MHVSDQPLAICFPLWRAAIVAAALVLGPLPGLRAREIPAFPGAQGWGATTPGGRNGRVPAEEGPLLRGREPRGCGHLRSDSVVLDADERGDFWGVPRRLALHVDGAI
jgi:hypothetical protein